MVLLSVDASGLHQTIEQHGHESSLPVAPGLRVMHRVVMGKTPNHLRLASSFPPADHCAGPSHPKFVLPDLQVMLQPRCLLIMRNQACSKLLHSIQTQEADTISDYCLNTQSARVQIGQVVPRSKRRISLVFVHKQYAEWLC